MLISADEHTMTTNTTREKAETVATAAVAAPAPDTRRVKVYSYGQSMQWEDMGTGHVSMDFIERNQTLTIMVRSEENGKQSSSCRYCVYFIHTRGLRAVLWTYCKTKNYLRMKLALKIHTLVTHE